MAAGHVDPTIKTNVQNNTVFNAVIDATVINAWRAEVASKIDDNYDNAQTKVPLLTGTGSPIGVVTPTVIGQTYTDRSSGLIYTATALTNTSWIIPAPYNFITQQAIINAAMEIWQQGTTFTNPATTAYTADMWLVTIANTGTLPTSIIHSQVALTAGELFNSKYAYNINVNGAGSGFGSSDLYHVKQKIEHGTSKLCGNGKKITVSFYAKSNISNKRIAVGMAQNYGTGGSPSSTGVLTPTVSSIRTLTSSMALYTFTFNTASLAGKTFGTNNDDYLELRIYQMWGSTTATNIFGGGTAETFVGSGDIAFTEVVVNAGDVALPFQPKSYGDELLACARYCKVLKGFNRAAFNAGNTFTTAKYFDLPMRVPPSLDTTYLGSYANSAGAPGANQWNMWYPQTAATITWGTAPSTIQSDYSTTDMINLFMNTGVTPSLGTVGAEYSVRFGTGSMLIFSARL